MANPKITSVKANHLLCLENIKTKSKNGTDETKGQHATTFTKICICTFPKHGDDIVRQLDTI
jgi:hypothetical protein